MTVWSLLMCAVDI